MGIEWLIVNEYLKLTFSFNNNFSMAEGFSAAILVQAECVRCPTVP